MKALHCKNKRPGIYLRRGKNKKTNKLMNEIFFKL